MRKTYDAAVIGSGGFVGSNLADALKRNKKSIIRIEKDTSIDEIREYSLGSVYFCAGNPLTFLSKKEPVKCMQQNVAELYPYLGMLEYKKFVYISSILVYPQSSICYKESMPIDISQLGLYGAHKYMGERYVREFAKTWLIVRPTSFFGNGLKKNLLFDLQHDNPNIYLKKDSRMDYMPIDWFCEALVKMAEAKCNEIINVGSGLPISVSRIISFKNLPYIFHEERWQDDRRIDFEKFKSYGLPMLKYDKLEEMIKVFVSADSAAFRRS
jgi:nucleoside-diphosphate-sugar epimerase